MKIKKKYSFTNKRQIWRLLPTTTGKLVIEGRDTQNKEVFFNCLDINSGKKIFTNLQLEEKFWIGIETIVDDIIIFHKFAKPDMPGHSSIIAFDINTQKIVWQNNELTFLFVHEQKVYVYKQRFEGRIFFSLDINNGEIIKELGNDANEINSLQEKSISINKNYESYNFPEPFNPNSNSAKATEFINEFKIDTVITGNIDTVELPGLLLFNCHTVKSDGQLKNVFYTVDIERKKIIFEEVLDESTTVFIPDAFFIKDDLIFLLIEKVKLLVCSIQTRIANNLK